MKVFALGLTILISVFLALFGALFVWCLCWLLPSQALKFELQHQADCKALIQKLEATVGKAYFCHQAARLIQESTAYDRDGLENFITKVYADQESHTCGVTDTISLATAKKRMSKAMATDGTNGTDGYNGTKYRVAPEDRGGAPLG